MYSQAHVSSHKGASVALRDRWWLKRRRREAEGPALPRKVSRICGWKGGRPWVRLKEEPKVHKRLLGRLRLSCNLLLCQWWISKMRLPRLRLLIRRPDRPLHSVGRVAGVEETMI